MITEFSYLLLGLKLLIRLSSDLGLKEATEYALELKKVERVQEQRDIRATSGSRPGSRRLVAPSGMLVTL